MKTGKVGELIKNGTIRVGSRILVVKTMWSLTEGKQGYVVVVRKNRHSTDSTILGIRFDSKLSDNHGHTCTGMCEKRYGYFISGEDTVSVLNNEIGW